MATLGVFIALLISMAVLRFIYSKSCLINLDVNISISAAAATEGDELVLTEVIKNGKWLPLPWLGVKFQISHALHFADSGSATISDAYYRSDLFHVLMHQKITRRLKFTCTKRGFYTLRGLEITGWDIFMENKYIKMFESDAHLTVYPGTIDTPTINDICTRIYGHLASRHPIYPDPFSFRGIREYSSADPMKVINFKASAKAQSLMVNVQDFSNTRQVVLLLDTERHTIWHNEALDERAIKLVSSFAEKLTMDGVPMSFITNGKSIRSGSATNIPQGRGMQQLRAILEALAYIDLSAKDIDDFAPTLETLAVHGALELEYWLISPYYSKEIECAYLRLKESGARTVWIMPEPRPSGTEVWDGIIFA